MDDQVLALVIARLDKLEEKVDRLLAFRAWLIGVGAAAGTVASAVWSWATGSH